MFAVLNALTEANFQAPKLHIWQQMKMPIASAEQWYSAIRVPRQQPVCWRGPWIYFPTCDEFAQVERSSGHATVNLAAVCQLLQRLCLQLIECFAFYKVKRLWFHLPQSL
jgi:hypothetical protein